MQGSKCRKWSSNCRNDRRRGPEGSESTRHNCPPNFADDLTRATNTQNRIERRDFAALDPNQKRLRTELLLECQKEYAYQSGENAPQESIGCTLDEAAVALACAMQDVGLSVQAKREVGMLYEDIAKAPYVQLF